MIKVTTPIDFSVDTKLPQSQCCACGTTLDGAAGRAAPKPGDFSICIYCGALSVFDEDLKLREPTQEEAIAFAESECARRAQEIIFDMKKKTDN